ncbi:YccF domain-containing protein [Desulfovibrio sp. OttesenSCG-928-F20]|nr:YccF domain-containing protein [Desulfovibrio sp. OttesenSCG-928-M16]MDL2291250.1 YccF domain-containing protein [Desulfovibrio sp. OttesenSCG-928-F20]
MRILGNILWHIPLCGFLTALAVFLLGGLLTITVVAAPIGLGLLQYAKFLLLPFSFEMMDKSELGQPRNPFWLAYSTLIMLLYLPLGLVIMIIGLFQAVALALTIVGIPTALVIARSLTTFLNPVGKVCVNVDVGNALRRRKAEREADGLHYM